MTIKTEQAFADLAEFGVRIKVPAALAGKYYAARFIISDFVSVNPLTNAPDFACLTIDYIPNEWLIENSSLKFYLDKFGEQPAFQENCAGAIGSRLAQLLEPHWLRVSAYWPPHGNAPIHAVWQTSEAPESAWLPEQNIISHSVL